MTYNEWRKSQNKSKGTSGKSGTFGGSTAGDKKPMSYNEWRKAQESKKPTFSTAQEWADSGVALMDDVQRNAGNWFGEDVYQSRSGQFESLIGQGDYWRQQYEGNSEAQSYIDSLLSALTGARDYTAQARDYYGQWNSAEDYGYFTDWSQKDGPSVDAERETLEEQIKLLNTPDILLAWDLDKKLRKHQLLENGTLSEGEKLESLRNQLFLLDQAGTVARYRKYAGLQDRADFAEKSQYRSTANGKTRDWLQTAMNTYGDDSLSGWDDPLYEYINGNQEAGAWIQNKAGFLAEAGSGEPGLAGAFGRTTEGQQRSQTMTEDEIATYNYIHATEGKEAAREYYELLSSDLNLRHRMEEEQWWAQYAKEDPFGSSAFSILTSPLKGLNYVGQAGDYLADGELEDNAAYNRFSYIPGAVRGEVDTQIREAMGEKWGPVGSFGYQTAMSMGDFLMNTAVSGGNSTVATLIMGSGAAADTTLAAKDRGLTDDQAFALGSIAGIAEALTEKVSLETLLNPDMSEGMWKYVLKNILAEGSEEAASDYINLAADLLISADKAELRQRIQELEKAGKTSAEALGIAVAEQAMTTSLDFLGGALSGGVMSGVGAGGYAINTGIQGKGVGQLGLSQEQIRDVIDRTLETQTPGSQAYKMAQGLQEKLQAGKTLNRYDLGRLLQTDPEGVLAAGETAGRNGTQAAPYEAGKAGEREISAPDTSVNQRSEGRKDALMALASEMAGMSQTNGESKGKFTPGNNEAQGDTALQKASRKYGAQAKAMESIYIQGQDVAEYDAAFRMAYEYGRYGAKKEAVRKSEASAYLTESQWDLAYELGSDTRKGYMAYYNAGFMGLNAEEVTSGSNGLTRQQRAQAWQDGADAARASLRKGQTTAFVSQGTRGSVVENTAAMELRRSDPSAYKAAEKLAADMGVNILIENIPDGQNGSIRDGVIRVNANALTEENRGQTLARILAHETTHRLKQTAPEGYAAYRDYALRQVAGESGGDLEGIIRQYQQAYAGTAELSSEEAMDEIAADYTTRFLKDTKLFAQFVGQGERNRRIGRKLIDALRAVLKKIRETFSSQAARDAAAMERLGTDFQEAQEALRLWEKAYAQAVRAVKKAPAREGQGGEAQHSVSGSEEILSRKKITAGMSDGDRTSILMEKNIAAPVYTGQADTAIQRERGLNSRKRSLAEAALLRIGEEFGIYTAGRESYNIADLEVRVSLSKGTIRESAHKEVTDHVQLAKLIPLLQNAAESAVGVEAHDNRYFFDNMTVRYHELLGGYIDGAYFIPVRFGVKELRDGSMGLHVMVSQEKIKTGFLGTDYMENSSGQPAPPPVRINVAQIVRNVNTPDLLRYLPDGMLDQRQRELKYGAIADTILYTNIKNDKRYFEAIQGGNLIAAEQMVRQAAEAAGYRNLFFHGAKNGGGFTQFRDWSYFTGNESYARRYAKRDTDGALYRVYARVDAPFDTRDADTRRIFEEEIRPEYGTGEIQDTGLPDWTDGYDIADYIDEAGLSYDSIILDEGGDLVNGEPVSRGESYVIRKSAQVKSAETITYDDDGAVIPLSKRFDREAPDIRYSLKSGENILEENRQRRSGTGSLQEWEVTSAVYEALERKRGRNEQLIRLGKLPGVLSELIGSEADIYARGNHLYENIVDRETAEREGRRRKGAHYHNLGVETVIDAILALEQPVMILNDPVNENPTVLAVLPVKAGEDAVYAAMSFYSAEQRNDRYEHRPHVVLTISPIPAVNTEGRKGLSDMIQKAASEKTILYLDKKMTAALPVNAQNVNLGIVTDASVRNSLAQFQKEVNRFKEKNKISYSLAGSGNILEENRKQRLQEAAEKYGVIEAGENPSRKVNMPRMIDDKKRVSLTIRTALEAGVTPETLIPKIEETVLDGQFSDEVYGNKKLMADAREWVSAAESTEKALTEWQQEVNKGMGISAKTEASGYLLYNQLATEAARATDTETQETYTRQAIDVLTDITNMTRNAARMVQATRILKRMGPEGKFYSLQRAVENLNTKILKKTTDLKLADGREKVEIDQDLATQWMMYLQAGREAEAAQTEEALYQDIARQVKRTFLDRWNAWRYLSMLGNAKTLIRNLVGNMAMAPMKVTKDKIAAGMEAVFLRDKSKRTKHLGTTLDRKGRALRKFAREDYGRVAELMTNPEKYNEFSDKRLMLAIREYKNRFQAPILRQWQGAVDWVMNGKYIGDVAFLQLHYTDTFSAIARARGWTADQIRSGQVSQEALDEARSRAFREAQKATFRDVNAVSGTLRRLRFPQDTRGGRAGNIILDGLIPFRSTPANVLVRAIEYSPVELIFNLTVGTADVARGKLSAVDYIDRMASGLTGTGVLVLGMFLRGLGLLSGGSVDDDEEREGIQEYALNIGGKSFSLDWLSPAAIPLFMGVECYGCVMEPLLKGEKIDLGGALDAVSRSFQPILEMSCLSSINSLLDSLTYAEGADFGQLFYAFFAAPFLSYVGQAVPTLLSQTSATLEQEGEKTYTADIENQLWRNIAYDLAKLAEKFPYADWRQVPRVDAWGRVDEGNGWAENFLSPSYVNDITVTEADREIARLKTVFQQQIDTLMVRYNAAEGVPEKAAIRQEISRLQALMAVSPDLAGTKISGVRLSQEEYTQYALTKGANNWALASKLIGSEWYRGLSDENKAEALQLAYELADHRGKYAAVGLLDDSAWTAELMDSSTEDAVAGIRAKQEETMALRAKRSANAAFREAISGNADASRAVSDLMDMGLSQEDVWTDAREYIRDLWMKGEINDSQALAKYKRYGNLSSEEAVDKVQYLKYQKANPEYADLSQRAGLMYERTLKSMGVDVADWYMVYKTCSSFDAKNEKGESVSGLKKERAQKYIESLKIPHKDIVWKAVKELQGWK